MKQAVALLDNTIDKFESVTRGEPRQLVMNNGTAIDYKFVDYDYNQISNFVQIKLSEISKEKSCRVLYVAERSSHVWGSSHAKSDNDIKAIIYYKPRQYYSAIKQLSRQWKKQYGPRDNTKEHKKSKSKSEQKDSKEEEQLSEPDVELTCIEVTKLCQLIINNDPNIFEVYTSPLPYYIESVDILHRFREIIYRTYDWFKLATHYLAWAKGNYYQIVKGSKKRMAKKPLKISLYVWRGLLSAEWLLEHKQCEGLPLYIPDLISWSRILDAEEKRLLMSLLMDKVRKSQYEVDCEDSRRMIARAPEVLGILDGMMKSSDHKSAGKKAYELRKQKNMKKDVSSARMLEELVYEIIESFK